MGLLIHRHSHSYLLNKFIHYSTYYSFNRFLDYGRTIFRNAALSLI